MTTGAPLQASGSHTTRPLVRLIRLFPLRGGCHAFQSKHAFPCFFTGSAFAALVHSQPSEPTIVKIDSGSVQGVAKGSVISWKGIPYAAPPISKLRWRVPQPAIASHKNSSSCCPSWRIQCGSVSCLSHVR